MTRQNVTILRQDQRMTDILVINVEDHSSFDVVDQ